VPKWAQPPLPARFADTESDPFVGRHLARESLGEAWTRVEHGQRQAVFIGGEPGSGKSRLAAETARALHREGAAVLLGTTTRDLGYPYQPLVEVLDQVLLDAEPGGLADVMPGDAAELLRITPNVRRHGPDLAEPEVSDHEYRRELFDSYAGLFRNLARIRPVALILEDLHWSSAPTRHLLSHVIDTIEDSPVLVIGTMRNSAPDRSDGLGAVIAELHRHSGVARIDLGGLDVSEIESYLVARGAGAPGRLGRAAMLLRDQTGGNPLFLREIWGEMAKSGGLAALEKGRLSPGLSIKDALERPLGLLSDQAVESVELAAILGASFEVRDLAAATGWERGQVLASLDEAVAFGLIQVDSGAARFAFRHALIRNTILDRLAPFRAASLHLRLGEALESRYEANPSLAPLLARLYEGAEALGSEEKIAHYNAESARQAEQGLAYEEAALFWERAAEGSEQEQRAEDLLMCSARNHLLAGEFPEARRLFSQLHESRDPRTCLAAAIGFEDASWRPGLDGRSALRMLSAAMDAIDHDPTDPLYVQALASLGRAHAFVGDLDGAEPLTSEALRLARSLGDEQLIAYALQSTLHRFWSIPGPEEVAVQAAAELHEIGVRTRDYDLAGPAGAYTGFSAYMSGDMGLWAAGWDDLSLAVDKTGQPFWKWVQGCFEHCHHFMRGEFLEAEAAAERNRELGLGFGSDDTDGPYGIQMYMVKRETGRLDAIRPLISGDPAVDGTWAPGLLALYTELRMAESTRNLFWDLVRDLPETDRRSAVWPALVAFLAEAAIYLGDIQALEAVEPLVSQYAGLNLPVGLSVGVFGSADRYLAGIAAGLGRLDEAEDLFETALAMDVQTGSVVHQAETLARLTVFMREQREDLGRAAEYESEARALAEPRSHMRVVHMLDQEMPYPNLPDGLTPREVDVLGLLVEGSSNREIGERLHISSNTAANHVRSILVKTGSANRTAAAMYAAERDLI